MLKCYICHQQIEESQIKKHCRRHHMTKWRQNLSREARNKWQARITKEAIEGARRRKARRAKEINASE